LADPAGAAAAVPTTAGTSTAVTMIIVITKGTGIITNASKSTRREVLDRFLIYYIHMWAAGRSISGGQKFKAKKSFDRSKQTVSTDTLGQVIGPC